MDDNMNVAAAADTQPAVETNVSNEPAPATVKELVQNEPAASPAPANNDAGEASDGPKERYVLYTDDNGNKELKIVRDEVKPAETQEEEAQPEQDDSTPLTQEIDNVAEQTNAPAEPYNLNEFLNALTSDSIDESRIPADYMKQYTDYKIQQAIAAKNKQVEMQRQQQEQVNQKLTPEQEQANMKTFLQNLDEEAGKRAAQDVGMTEEDMANLDFMDDGDEKLVNYKLAKDWHRNRLMVELQQRATVENDARQKQAAIYQEIQNFTTQAKQSEPNFDAIDKMMSERYKTLPYAEGKRVEQVLQALGNGTITEAQTVELKNYYDATRKEYYAKKNGLSTTPKRAPKPPAVERAGTGKEIEHTYTPDYAALRKGDPKQQIAWLAEYLRNKGR